MTKPLLSPPERIHSGAADHKEDGTEALAKLGIERTAGMTDKAPRQRANQRTSYC
jgi:hypothetical protein